MNKEEQNILDELMSTASIELNNDLVWFLLYGEAEKARGINSGVMIKDGTVWHNQN
jgi:hypothetical protein